MVSDWALRGIHRRDTRNEKIEDIRPPAKRGNKNTKRWCRGVEGREHQNEWIFRDLQLYGLHELKCIKCGKVLKSNFVSKRWGYHG